MKVVADFIALLGPPMRTGGHDELRAVAERWGVVFPADFLNIVAAYGDSVIADHITLFGPSTLEKMSTYRTGGVFPLSLDESAARPVFPRAGGLLEWAMSSTGDAFCLRDEGHGKWVVSTFDQLAFEWIDYNTEFSDWLHYALSVGCELDIFPPFGDLRPLRVIPLDVEKYLAW